MRMNIMLFTKEPACICFPNSLAVWENWAEIVYKFYKKEQRNNFYLLLCSFFLSFIIIDNTLSKNFPPIMLMESYGINNTCENLIAIGGICIVVTGVLHGRLLSGFYIFSCHGACLLSDFV